MGTKTSKIMSEFGDKFGGGEGQIKRAILKASSPEEAISKRNILNASRVRSGGEAVYKMTRAQELAGLEQRIVDAGIDPVVLQNAVGGNKSAVADILASSDPAILNDAIRYDSTWKMASQEIGGRQLEAAGIPADQMMPLYGNDVAFHQATKLSDEARAAGVGGAETAGKTRKVRGPDIRRTIEPGQEFLGETLRHPTDWTTRAVIRSGKNGEKVEVIGVGVGRGAAGQAEAIQNGSIEYLQANRNIEEPMVRYKTTKPNGKVQYKTAPANTITFERVPPAKGGLSVREQANAINNKIYGYDLFDQNWITSQRRALEKYTSMHGEEVQAAYLRNRPLGNPEFDVILKDYPKAPAKARQRIFDATDNLIAATDASNDAYIARIMAQSDAVVALREAGDRVTAAWENVIKQMRRLPADSPKQQQLRATLEQLRNEHAALSFKIDSLAEKITTGEVKSAGLQEELAKVLGGGTPTAKKAAKNIAGAGVATGGAIPDATGAATGDAGANLVVGQTGIESPLTGVSSQVADDFQIRTLQSDVRDAEYQLSSLRAEPGVPASDIRAAEQELQQAQMALDGYMASRPPVEPTGGIPKDVVPQAPTEAPGVPTGAGSPQGAGAPTGGVTSVTPQGPVETGGAQLVPSAEGITSAKAYSEGEVRSAIVKRNDLQAQSASLQDELAASRAKDAKKVEAKFAAEPKSVKDANRRVVSAVAKVRSSQGAARDAALAELDAARSELANARQVAAETKAAALADVQDSATTRKILAKVDKNQAALDQLTGKYQFLTKPGGTGTLTAPEFVPQAGVRPSEIVATLSPEKQAEIAALQERYRISPDAIPEFIARSEANDIATQNYQSLVESGAAAEQIAVAEEQMFATQRALSDMKQAWLDTKFATVDAKLAAERIANPPSEAMGAGRSWQVEPPSGGYSPEWETATQQYAKDIVATNADLSATLETKIGRLRKENKASLRAEREGVQNARTAKRASASVRDEQDAIAAAQKLIGSTEKNAIAASEAAMEEKAAWESYQAVYEDAKIRSSSYPKGFETDPNFDPKVLEAKRLYEQKAIATKDLVQRSEGAAKIARFAATTDGVTESQINRLVMSVESGNVDETLKQVVSEAGLPTEQKQAVRQSIIDVGDDTQAAGAIVHNAGDEKITKQIVKNSKVKTEATTQMGGGVGTAPTGEQAKRLSTKAKQKIADLKDEIAKTTKAQKRLSTQQKTKIAELDSLNAGIDTYSKQLAKIEKQKAKVLENARATAYAELNDATKAQFDQLVRGQRSIELALAGESQAALDYGKAADDYAYAVWLHGPKADEAFRYVVRKGFQEISRSSQAPIDVADAMAMITRVNAPKELPGFLKYFDKMTRLFKSWAVATPGFIARNGYSGIFMNYLFDVSPGSMQNFLRADRAFSKAIAAGMSVEDAFLQIPTELRAAYQQVHNSGVLELGGQVENTLADLRKITDAGGKTGVIDRIANTPINKATYRLNTDMERVLRGASAMHAASNGAGVEGIYDLVFKAHFNYSDLNNFENSVMKRVSPFYTWFRKNLPTQMEMVFKNPKAYARYVEAKDAIEAVSNPEDLMPSWMKDRMSIRLPFALPGGQTYLMPDMPIKDLNVLGNLNDLVGQVNPVIKTPFEMMTNRKMYFGESAPFSGLVQMPTTYEKTGLGIAMEALGLAKRDVNGNLMVEDRNLYAIEQFFPFFGRARRLLPNEPKYQDRLPITVLNTLFGLSLRTNTKADQMGELRFRQQKIDNMAQELMKLGYGGYDYWQKQIAMASKPSSTDVRPYLTLIQPKGGLPASSPFTNVSGTQQTDWSTILANVAQTVKK